MSAAAWSKGVHDDRIRMHGMTARGYLERLGGQVGPRAEQGTAQGAVMQQRVANVMTSDPVVVDAGASIIAAAQVMREHAVGGVLISDADRVCGIVTDRDLVVRGLADGRSLDQITLRDVCSPDLATISAEADVDDAVLIMRRRALRRLAVVAEHRLVGIVSIGDLAVDRDRGSALADISAASPNT
jgi:CBS domain-containing protein